MSNPEAQPKTVEELGTALSGKDRVLAAAYLATFKKRKAGVTAKYSEKSPLHLRRPGLHQGPAQRRGQGCRGCCCSRTRTGC
ncbi:hypothetical protein SAMN00790413_01882 [Deinococcus hopiensis KR-140]|uniref:Uncharacterized protein n=1 Tax=Deinococcus hopiensis KR-140 TaxID=695939 RepID=A0A1W1VIN9_9DEIO|nr:hypothetical protein SAMN00790413_01882 [Deinococcus hopiensis KR-140]